MYGFDCTYGKYLVNSDNLSAFLSSLSEENIAGFNITMPLKQDIIPYLTYISPEAKKGVNTVCVKPDGLYGYSTDAQGFYASLKQIDADYKNRNIVLIGAGAVAELLSKDAITKGAKHITFVNRTIEKAKNLSTEINADADSLSNISLYMKNCDLLINTTSLGMNGTHHNFESLDFLNLLSKHAVVCDLIYSPMYTTFLQRAASRNLKTMNGLGMLIWQAFYSFEKWFQVLPSETEYATVFSKIMKVLEAK